MQKINLNSEVTKFLDGLNHPFRQEIEQLRINILNAHGGLTENIKWNGPNYCFNNEDRITMRIQPPKKQIQLIFHRGAQVKEQPKEKLIPADPLLAWKANDRAVATFSNMTEIENSKPALARIVTDWISAAS
ncbi:MAG: DUF1801 domain-containing protein [Bacteroidota bacterium]|nr:DUF1801 domain-containing protein [Bacteroidota bacterium]